MGVDVYIPASMKPRKVSCDMPRRARFTSRGPGHTPARKEQYVIGDKT